MRGIFMGVDKLNQPIDTNELMSLDDMANGHLDVATLGEAANEDKVITSRLGRQYPSAPMASRLLVENGMLGATPFSTYSAMIASALVDGDYAIVTNDTDLSKNGVYEKAGSVWVYSKYNTQQLVNELSNVLRPQNQGLFLTDDDGFEVGRITERLLQVYDLISVSHSDNVAITDSIGFIISDVAGFSAEDDGPELLISEPIFTNVLCAFANETIDIDVPSLVSNRSLQYKTRQMVASFATAKDDSARKGSVSSAYELKVDVSLYGESCFLTLKDSEKDGHVQIPVAIKIAPQSTISKVLLLGDSITNRGLGDACKKILTSRGHSAEFIGTMRGAATNSSPSARDGELGEGREGYETGDYTYAITDRALVLAVGDEQMYLNLSQKTSQRDYNPFLRQASISDNESVIRNGYVFDPAFYQSRFALDTPDVVVVQLGTNDIRDRNMPDLVTGWYDNTQLMINQIKSAWPNAHVVLSLPSTANEEGRNILWETEYYPLIRKMLEFQTLDNVTVCPTWALMSSDTGYSVSNSLIDAVTGAITSEYDDPIHPLYTPKYQMSYAISACIACAKA